MKKKTVIFKLHAETKIPKEWRDSVPSSGPADDAVEYLCKKYNVECLEQDAIKYLKLTGGWSLDELQYHDRNIERLVWISTLDCKEQNTCYWYMGE